MALGPESAVDDARARMHAYDAFTGTPERMVSGMLTTAAAIRTAVTAFADLGADEVMLYCHGTDPDQVDRRADLL